MAKLVFMVERGFSINSECLVTNLEEDSLIAQRSVISAVTSYGGIENVPITKSMIISYTKASAKRVCALKEKQNKEEAEKYKL